MNRYVIINADDLGLTEGANLAAAELFEAGAISSASLMAPCPLAADAAERCAGVPAASIGIHAVLTGSDRLRPVYGGELPTLVDADGRFHADPALFERCADPEEVRLELDAQVRTAMKLGIRPTHLDCHQGCLLGLHSGRGYFEAAFDACREHGLPFLLPTRITEQPFFTPEQLRMFERAIADARRHGIPLIDDIVTLPYEHRPGSSVDTVEEQMREALRTLRPGITQLTFHPAYAEEGDPHGLQRELERIFLASGRLQTMLKEADITVISWQDVRGLRPS